MQLVHVYCPACEERVRLTEEGHCNQCGKYFDNMYPKLTEETYDDYVKRRQIILSQDLLIQS